MSGLSERERRLRDHEHSRRSGYVRNYRDRSRDRPRETERAKANDYNRNYEHTYEEKKKLIVREKPNFEPSGLLAKESNSIKGTQLKYTEPGDSILPSPDQTYHLYSFIGDDSPNIIDLTSNSHYLIGRDQKVVQIWIDDQSCSKQHAVIQFRNIKDPSGGFKIKPYIIDLESTNGTFLNGQEIPTSRLIELKPEDVLKFGESDIDHVLMVSS